MYITITIQKYCKYFTYSTQVTSSPLYNFDKIILLLGTKLPLVVESFGLLNDIFPFPSILDAGYPVFNLHLANIQ